MDKNIDYQQLAETRHNLLWEFYNTTGKLTTQDIMRLCNTRHSISTVRMIKKRGFDIPPIYNSREAVANRQATTLWKLAGKKKKIHRDVVCEEFGLDYSAIKPFLNKFEKFNLDIPEIFWKQNAPHIRRSSYGPIKHNTDYMYRQEIESPYSIKVMSVKPYGDNQWIALLK